jgi:thiosulfate dehydrogenase (quinone) large subunit
VRDCTDNPHRFGFQFSSNPGDRYSFLPISEANTITSVDVRRCSQIDAMSRDLNRNVKALAGLRIAVGVLFLIFAEYKVFGTQFTLGGGFQFWINRFLEQGAYPFMAGVLRSFVLPHATVIAFTVAYGELAIGLGLVLGIFVRVASIFGMIFMTLLLFSSNYPGAHAPLWQYFGAALDHLVLALCFGTFAVADGDQVFSARLYLKGFRHPPK